MPRQGQGVHVARARILKIDFVHIHIYRENEDRKTGTCAMRLWTLV